jgi:prephenate dehydratase
VIDLNLLRENPEAIKASQRARRRDENLVDQAAELDTKRRKALAEFEFLSAEQNAHSKLVSTAPKDEKAAFIAAPTITNHHKLITPAKSIGENKQAQTRFIQIGLARVLPKSTRADKTSVIVELTSDQPGPLLAMLDQFSTRSVNLTRIESKPIGDKLGRYRFNIDSEGNVLDKSMGEALAGLHKFSPKVSFLSSSPRTDKCQTKPEGDNSKGQYLNAVKWLQALRGSK